MNLLSQATQFRKREKVIWSDIKNIHLPVADRKENSNNNKPSSNSRHEEMIEGKECECGWVGGGFRA